MEIAEAEDLSQNVMIVIHRHAGDVRDELLFQGWIFKVAKNELARYWRQRQTRERIAGMEPLSDLLTATLVAETSEDGNNNFSEWMSHLDALERELLILRFVEGLSYEELALALGDTRGDGQVAALQRQRSWRRSSIIVRREDIDAFIDSKRRKT
ncbi:MAG: sigma-70 family RNA polymerase sigma factor [Acidobacteria bacterium]|nr:sigma-70 family RNA polymerase sigma factor [Acidobacteriota bacterium]